MTATSADTGSAATSYGDLSAALGIEVPQSVYTHAFTHRSFAYENGGIPTNERLEFLGDSVLGVVVTEALYRRHPDLSEGRLAKLRAAVVNMKALAGVARGLDLGRYILLGRGEETTGGRDKDSILADSTEALLGAVYLEHGFVSTTRLIRRLFDPLMEQSAALGAGLDWKTSLQELVATLAIGVPEYVVSESGPDHAKSFEARVRVGEQLYGHGIGRSKKEAEQQAAETAWKALKPAEEGAAEAADAAEPADSSAHA